MKNMFSDYITKKFLDWQAESGKRRTIAEFAAYLGVSRVILTMWMNGKRRPGPENIKMLAATFGPEVYDALGIPRPDPDLETVKDLWDSLPPDKRREIREQVERYAAEKPPKKAASALKENV